MAFVQRRGRQSAACSGRSGFRPGASAASAAEAPRQRGRPAHGRLHVRAGAEAPRPRPVWRSRGAGQRVPANRPESQLPLGSFRSCFLHGSS